MKDEVVVYAATRASVENACSGSYTQLGPATPMDEDTSRERMTSGRLVGVALKKGRYRVTFERVGD